MFGRLTVVAIEVAVVIATVAGSEIVVGVATAVAAADSG